MNGTLIKNPTQDYKIDYDYLDDCEPEPLFDENGNPTPETLKSFYEIENGLTEEVKLEELMAWANE